MAVLSCQRTSVGSYALGRRIVFEDPVAAVTTRYYYDGQSVIEERDAADVRVRYHLNGAQFIDERVATFTDATARSASDTSSGRSGSARRGSIERRASIEISSSTPGSRLGTGEFTYYLVNQSFSIAGTGNADGTEIERLDYSSTGDFAGGGAGAASFFHDTDADLDLDLRDFAGFQNCFGQTDPTCLAAHDFDTADVSDGGIDLADYARFDECSRGPFVTPDQICGVPSRSGSPPPSGTFTLHGRPVDILSDDHAIIPIRARYYDPVIGRWLQRDPTGFADGANLYESFRGNATRFTNPEGTGPITGFLVGDFTLSDMDFIGAGGLGAAGRGAFEGSPITIGVQNLQARSEERFLLLIQAQQGGDLLFQSDAGLMAGGLLLALGDFLPSGRLAEGGTGISTGLSEAAGTSLSGGTRVLRTGLGVAETGLFALFSTTALQSGAAAALETRFFLTTGGRLRLGLFFQGQLVGLLEAEAAAGNISGQTAVRTLALGLETGVEQFALRTAAAGATGILAARTAFLGRTESLPRLLGIAGGAGESAAAELLIGGGEFLVNTQFRQGAVLRGFDSLSVSQSPQGINVFLNEVRNSSLLQSPSRFSAFGVNRASTFTRNILQAQGAVQVQLTDPILQRQILSALQNRSFTVRIIGRRGIRITPSTALRIQTATGTSNDVLILEIP